MNRQGSTGIYCLANDNVLEWMIALLESLRSFEPSRELIVIPFDANIAKLSQLSGKYGFRFLSDDSLEMLDRVGAEVNPDGGKTWQRTFRKLACFWGPFNHFLFLDADIVILSELNEVFEAFLGSDYEFLYFDRDMEMAYQPGAFRDMMVKKHSSVGFNSGAFVSSKGCLSMGEVLRLAGGASSLIHNFTPNGEQSFLNYCIDIKDLNKQQYCKVVPHASCSNWAKWPIAKAPDGFHHISDPGHDSAKSLLFVHWAGFNHGPLMPHRRLFLRFRHYDKPTFIRVRYYGLDLFLLLWVLLQALGHKALKFLSFSS
jgi:hypothetical protein